jgi:hypothetical protein
MQNIKMLRSPLTVLYLFLCIVPSGALAQTTDFALRFHHAGWRNHTDCRR